MFINVTKDNVIVAKDSFETHQGEYNVTTCYFTFSEEFDSLVKIACFTINSTNETYKIDIVDNECSIPAEVLEKEFETITLGVYGYSVDQSDNLELRYSPTPFDFYVERGSYKEGGETPEIITPTQYELYSQKLQEGLDEIVGKLDNLTSATPLVASSLADMTDTTRIYVLTTNGHWYWYDGTSWVDGGVYQSTQIANGSIIPEMTKMWQRNNLVPKYNWKTGKVYNVNTGNLQNFTGSYNEEYVDIHQYNTLMPTPWQNSTMRIYYYDDEYTYLSQAQLNVRVITKPTNAYYCRFSLWHKEYTEMPDDITMLYDLDTFNTLIRPYTLKDYYLKGILNSDDFKCYDPYFYVTGEMYGLSTDDRINNYTDNSIDMTFVNNTSNTIYRGFYFRAKLKIGDVVKVITDYTGNLNIYPYNSTQYTNQLTQGNGFKFVVIDATLLSYNQGIDAWLISLPVPANTTINLKATLKINDKPISLNEFMKNIKNIAENKQTLNILALGDSITALTGSRSWLTYFNEIQPINIIQNVAVSGAWLMDKEGTVYDGNPVFNGSDNNRNNVLGNQVQKIINNNYDEPDIIMIAIGTNGGINCTEEEIYNSYYDSQGNLIPLESVDRKTSAGAFRYCNETLRELYPNATVFWCSPIQAYYGLKKPNVIINWGNNLKNLCEFSSVQFIDTQNCGITAYTEHSGSNGLYLIDGLHPNENGAKYMGYYNATKVKEYCDGCKLKNL